MIKESQVKISRFHIAPRVTLRGVLRCDFPSRRRIGLNTGARFHTEGVDVFLVEPLIMRTCVTIVIMSAARAHIFMTS